MHAAFFLSGRGTVQQAVPGSPDKSCFPDGGAAASAEGIVLSCEWKVAPAVLRYDTASVLAPPVERSACRPGFGRFISAGME